MKIFTIAMLATLLAGTVWQSAHGQAFNRIRIGDADGFGFPTTQGLRRAVQGVGPGPADTNGDGILAPSEFLPDLDGDGRVWFFGEDHFDNRSAEERRDEAYECTGCLAIGARNRGSNWTDLALTPLTTAGDWPDLNGPQTPNNATFVFDFTVAADAIVEDSEIFFNIVFGDFDIDPALIFLRFAGAPGLALEIPNQNIVNLDGLIQERTTSLAFSDIFTTDADGNWHGFAKITFDAPAEPWTAFDYAELSTFAAVAQAPRKRRVASRGHGLGRFE